MTAARSAGAHPAAQLHRVPRRIADRAAARRTSAAPPPAPAALALRCRRRYRVGWRCRSRPGTALGLGHAAGCHGRGGLDAWALSHLDLDLMRHQAASLRLDQLRL
jgi:hypothetical protein